MWLLEAVLFVSVLQREKEYYLQKLTTVSAVCLCVSRKKKLRLSSSKARVNPEYPSHFSKPFSKKGVGGGGVCLGWREH